MTNENEWWWGLKSEAVNSEDDSINLHPYGGDDGDLSIENLEKYTVKILAEHTRRIVEAVEGMRQEIKLLGNYERGCDKHLSATEECRCYGWNAALDEAIEKIKGLDREPS